ncbi:SRPBCC family protein [Streptomyces sp. NPDC006610]|uniref:SRPBCC family protein n=1 Tax=Streptomyces sp. NPDC006610 TaxID=3154584 RepID=UPI0033A7B6C2
MTDDLPFVDEHTVLVAASPTAVWRSLAHAYGGGSPSWEAYGRLVAADPGRTTGAPLAEGSTLPGFEVTESAPARLLRLTGRHRYSRYALTLTLTPRPTGTLLTARTHASFPGAAGRTYRRLVIASGAHRILMTRRLGGIRRRAESEAAM